MTPSVIGAQVRRGIEEFLRTTFQVTNPFFKGTLDELLREGEIFKGPYLLAKLPFLPSAGARKFFPEVVPQGFPPHRHQEQAWERLDWLNGQSTIVATGTGSGKTECFLFPTLDYCYQRRNKRGVKAIFIYPMNALATDQAKRVARTIFTNPNLRDRVTAGLYIGEQDINPSQGMKESKVITDRKTMQISPPDILLTNYKMLDFLLLRQNDLPLWRLNDPDTLRYLVVDELHTFDGAQGADVACLIRRLKERLKTTPGSLICVGTSATLGNSIDDPAGDRTAELVRYASKVFGEKFDPRSVIGESLQSADQFLGKLVQWFAVPSLEEKAGLNPLAYRSRIDYVRAQHQLWFGDDGHSSGPGTDAWNLALGERLRSHLFLRNLLVLMEGRAVDVNDLLRLIQARIPGFGKKEDGEYVARLLTSFLSLVSEARTEGQPGEPLLPFLQVRYQFWARELARVVSSVSRNPQWRLAADLKTEELRRSLP